MPFILQYQAALIAAILAAATIPILHIAILRAIRRSRLTTPLAFPCFAFSAIALFVIARFIGMPFDASRLLFSLGLLGFLCLGYLAIMFHLYRGFSNTLLTDIERLGDASVDDILAHFAEGSGADAMLHRRFDTMKAHHLIQQDGRTLLLTAKGARSARLALWYKHLFQLDSCG